MDVAVPWIPRTTRSIHLGSLAGQKSAGWCLFGKSRMRRTSDLGIHDKYSWIGWFTNHTTVDMLPFDRRYHPQPAYEAIRQH